VWAAFRLGRRARVLSVARGEEDGRPWVEAHHDGYRFLPGQPVHARRVSWDGVGWRVEDRVDGEGDHRAMSRVRIHPDLELRQEGPEWIAAGGGVACRLVPEGPAVFVREEGAYFPRFGESRPCTVLALAAGGRTPLRLAYRLVPSTRA